MVYIEICKEYEEFGYDSLIIQSSDQNDGHDPEIITLMFKDVNSC